VIKARKLTDGELVKLQGSIHWSEVELAVAFIKSAKQIPTSAKSPPKKNTGWIN
jgi:hypothetical protein